MQNYITTKTGRKIILGTEEEEAAIHAGIAADPDTYELSAEEFKRLRPVGRPKVVAEDTKKVTAPTGRFLNFWAHMREQ